MLKEMIDAYFDVLDKNITNYFQHCHISGKLMMRRHIHKLLSKGSRSGESHEVLHHQCITFYNAWKKNIRVVNNDVRENQSDIVILDDILNGAYWQTHGRN
jgi:hypothetical protein